MKKKRMQNDRNTYEKTFQIPKHFSDSLTLSGRGGNNRYTLGFRTRSLYLKKIFAIGFF